MRILFASTPGDGHFNPLTGIAVHLRDAGHDVRWYTGGSYASRLQELGIPHFAYQRARDINGENLATLFPERARLKGTALTRFDFQQIFIGNVPGQFEDMSEIAREFPLDVLLGEGGGLAARLVRDVLGKHVLGIGVGGAIVTRPDGPPPFVGWRPARTPAGRLLHQAAYFAMKRLVLDHGLRAYNSILAAHALPPVPSFEEVFDGHHVLFLNGVPGFEYPTRRPRPRVRYAGMLRPYRTRSSARPPELEVDGRRVVLISQGTVDNEDPGKLIVPALEALVATGALLVVGTGHKHTDALRRRFPQSNVSIHDYVDFEAVLERADVFVCNGGRGSVLLSLSKGVPLVVAGVREGKNDGNAHVEHFGVGVNLRTERPTATRIARAVNRVLGEPSFKRRALALRDEIARYRPLEIIDEYLATEVAAQPSQDQDRPRRLATAGLPKR